MNMALMIDFSSISAEIAAVVLNMRLSDELVKFVKDRENIWPVFGKKNSHLYRTQLMGLMLSAGMKPESKVMVYFFMAVIKNVTRVIKAMDSMEDTVKTLTWFSEVRDFFGTRVVQYVTQAERQRKFPAVNIPSTNPGLDILFWCMMTKDSLRTLENLKERTTFCQLALNDEMQTLAKRGYENYWNNVVKSSRNPDHVSMQLPAPQMREDYYLNPASDKYPLLSKNMTVIEPATNQSGYTRLEIERYLISFNAQSADALA